MSGNPTFVNSMDLFGNHIRQVPCIVGEGSPTTNTYGAVGMLYMDSSSNGMGEMWKCIEASNTSYTWVKLVMENVSGISDTARNLIIEIFSNVTSYNTDQTANIAALDVALGGDPSGSEPEEPDVPVDPEEPDVPVDPEEPDGPIYTLTAPYTTTGDSMLDTGVALADVDRDWTICCDLTGKPGYQIPAWGLGTYLGVWSTAAYKWFGGYNTTNWSAPTTTEIATGNLANARIVMAHAKGEATITVHYVSAGAAASLTASGLDYSSIVGSSATVTLGGAPKTEGNAYWSANNMINEFEIYERVLTEAEVTTWLGVS